MVAPDAYLLNSHVVKKAKIHKEMCQLVRCQKIGTSHTHTDTSEQNCPLPSAYQNGPDTPYCHATLELCKSVAAHVHELTMADAVRPVRIVRPAVLYMEENAERDTKKISSCAFHKRERDLS